MGTYNISSDELIDKLKEFLMSIEGEVSAEVLAQAWNRLALTYKWDDLLGVSKR